MSKHRFCLTIEVSANNHDGIVEGVEEALRRFKAGNIIGFDRKETACFSFQQEENMAFDPADFPEESD